VNVTIEQGGIAEEIDPVDIAGLAVSGGGWILDGPYCSSGVAGLAFDHHGLLLLVPC